MTTTPIISPREHLEALQLARLHTTLARLGRPERPLALDEVRELPFTTKDDLRAGYPLGAVRVPVERLRRLHSSSGTSGRPTIVGHTAADLDAWAAIMARSLAMAGVRPGTVVHNALAYGLTTGGFGFQQGAERLACAVVPAAGAPIELEVALLRDLRAEVLVSTPSFAAQLADAARGEELGLKIGIFGGEMWTEAMRDRIESALGLSALDHYGLSEVIGPGVAAECACRAGAHVHEDHFLAEVVDPGTGEPVAPGEVGELVLTTLTREAMPLLRYRTGDLTSLTTEPCACGRVTARMRRVIGRRRDLIEAGGASFYPSQVEDVLLRQPGIAPHYQLALAGDAVTVRCEGTAPAAPVEAALRDALGLAARVEVGAAGSVPRTEGKAVRVVR